MRRITSIAVALCLAVTACKPAARRGAASPSPSPTAEATPSASPSAAPGAGSVPEGFGALSVTFVSERIGWVLGVVPCAGGRCVAVVATTDGGGTWAESSPPPVPAAPASDALAARRIRFANARDGWAFDPGLWATHDGGAHWTPVGLPGTSPGAAVTSLEAASGRVHAAVLDGPSIRVLTSPVGSDTWQAAPVDLSVGAGPVPSAQIVLHGDAGWLVEVNRTVVDGARLRAGRWSAWDPPCLDAGGPAEVASSDTLDVVAVCNEGIWTGPEPAIRAYASTDGGSTFRRLPTPLPKGSDGDVARPDARSVVVAGSTDAGAPLLNATFDSGASWRNVYRGGSDRVLRELGFTTPGQGVGVEVGGDGLGGRLLMTRDGGRTWGPVSFRS